MSLPEWIKKTGCGCPCHKEEYFCDQCCDPILIIKALSIAWGALERATKPAGRFSMDHEEHAKNVIEDCAEDAKDAMRHIEALGE